MRTIALTLIILITHAGIARSAQFCVGSSNELINALDTARDNGQADEIKLQTGDYAVPGEAFEIFMLENHALTLSGGWNGPNNAPCAVQSGQPNDTVLDGLGQFRVLEVKFNQGLNFSASISMNNFTVFDGLSNEFDSAGLNVYCIAPCAANLLLDRIRFLINLGDKGAALRIVGGDAITVRNSVFANNHTRNAMGVISVTVPDISRGLYFINNTVIYNHTDVTTPNTSSTSGLSVSLNETASAFSQSFIANNLFWDNELADLFTNALGVHRIYSNNYQQRLGLADFIGGNINADPNLSTFLFSYAPQYPSPVINAGRSMPAVIPFPTPFHLGWDHGTLDYLGHPRVHNGRVDIGAVEAGDETPIFANSF